MANSYRNAAGLNPEDVYDPDVIGDGPSAAISGIGYRNAAGVLLKFAALKYGTAAANHGCRIADGRDFSALWAEKGTAAYSLPINGGTYKAASFGTVSSAMDAGVLLSINASGSYSVTSTGNGVATARATGTWLPAGQSASDYQVRFVVTQVSQQPTGPAAVTNGAAAYSACTSNRALNITASVGQLTGQDRGGVYTVALSLKRISTGVVNVTTIHVDVQSAGSG